MKSYSLLLIISLIPSEVFTQHFTRSEFTGHLSGNKTQPDSLYLITTNYPTTGIALNYQTGDSIEGSYIIVNSDTFYFHADKENINDEAPSFSNLYTSPVPIDSFLFHSGKIRYPVNFILINAQLPEEKGQLPTKKKSAGCSEPEMIDQSVWREGLEEPDYERIPNIVHNIIIHHSAGSNTDTNYIQVIRSIYIYHTEVRGWSDIGYNYLIAQDGTIFKGRDPGNLEQDNVLGAHFCGSNTGTMGICVLGNYMEISPSENAIQSLIDLITWKTGKDSLNPVGIYPHPLNSALHVIAGHRDGCATECPGDSLYNRLDTLRQLVMQKFDDCGFFIKPVNMVPSILDKFRL